MSTQPIHLAFLWHMHQPWYVDPASDKIVLPWVRLHGVSAYRDMAALLEDHPQLRATINLSPSLLDQLQLYLAGKADTYEDLTMRPAAELTSEERAFLIVHFFSIHWTTVIEQIPRYQELLQKRGREIRPGQEHEIAARFSDEDLRDLQVLFNLAWVGFSAAAQPEIAALLSRGRDFTEQDKQTVLAAHRQILATVLPVWQKLVQREQVEISCSAYYHPILPLLIDSNAARRGNPELRLPDRFCFAADACSQIERALDRIAAELGHRPRGMWPPEGAISPEMIKLAAKCGVQYLVTDSEILFRSLDDHGSTPGRRRLFQPYRFGDCALFFRSAQLSNLIAREYCSWSEPRAAAQDFLEQIRHAAANARLDGDTPPLITIALDGENPWEAYPRRGHDFLSALYKELDQAADITTVTLSEHLDRYPPALGLQHVHSGSWIEANYAIWIGDPDKNRAWNLLGRARHRLARLQTSEDLPAAVIDTALEHLYRAQGSDWFWWLGEPFSSAEEQLYDALFRNHVMAIYSVLEDSPPADLSRPISHGGIVDPLRQPTAFIQPRIDGTRTSFFEWRGAGFYRVPASGSMYQKQSFIMGLYWGFDAGRLFLRIDPIDDLHEQINTPHPQLAIWFELTGPEHKIIGQLDLVTPCLALQLRENGSPPADLGLVEEIAFREVIELAVPLARLKLAAGNRAGLSLHFAQQGQLLSRVPRHGVIEIEIPESDFGTSS